MKEYAKVNFKHGQITYIDSQSMTKHNGMLYTLFLLCKNRLIGKNTYGSRRHLK